MKIMITGASGFIGLNLIEHLSQKEGAQVYAIARSQAGLQRLQQFCNGKSGINIFQIDLADPEQLDQFPESPEIIINLAARVSDYGSYPQFFKDNVQTSENLLNFAAKIKQFNHFIHISTIDVYGYPDKFNIKEDEPLQPGKNHYNTSKVMAEIMVQKRMKQLPITILRPATVVGPQCQSLIGEITAMQKSGVMFYFNRGNRSAGLLDVRNLVDLICLISGQKKYINQVLNVADQWDVNWRQFVFQIGKMAGKKYLRINIPYNLALYLGKIMTRVYLWLGLKSRPPITPMAVQLLGTHQQCSVEKLTQTGFKPTYSYQDCLDAIEKWLSNLKE